MRKTRFFILMTICALILCGCGKGSVKLASEKQMASWCKEQFGKATVVEVKESEERIDYTMKDKENGFLYTASTYVQSVGMDGSTFWYSESRNSDFDKKYMEDFLNKNEEGIKNIESKYGVKILYEEYHSSPFSIYGVDEGKIKGAAKVLIKTEKSFDKRDYWGNMCLDLYSLNEYIGHYEEDNEYVSPADETVNWLLECAAIDMHVPVKNLEFVKSDTVPVENIKGYNKDELADIAGSDNKTKSMAEVCYFRYKGEIYYITDIIAYKDGKLVHLGDYPVKK